MKRLVASIVSAGWLAGCSLSTQDQPSLAGPSEFGLSLTATASPDVVTQDGSSASMIRIMARDANGRPVSGLSLRLGMFVGGTSVDYGTLMSKVVSTGSDGFASTIYTAPPPPPPTVSTDVVVDIQIVPTSIDCAAPRNCDFNNSTPRYVSIRLARPGVILPPNPEVTARFFYSPTQPREDEPVQFDASASTGANLKYDWAFGDGTTGSGVRPSHVYSVAGNYNVVLTVTDDRGTRASSAPVAVTVAGAPDPTAAFTISPLDPTVGTEVFFDGSPSTTPVGSGRTIVAYEWNFGDGTTGTGMTAAHAYARAGTYTIVLNVRDSSGRRGTTSRSLQVK